MTKLSAWIRGLRYPVINYKKEFGDQDRTINHAKGEILKPNQSRWPQDAYIGTRFVGIGEDEKGDFDEISIYLGGGWFKLISKVY